MFQVGQKVVYGIHGVCCITELEIKNLDRQKVEYYVLEPADQLGTRYYVPTQNPSAVAKLKPLLSRQELDELLRCSTEAEWITDENRRRQLYRELICSGNRAALIAMVRALHTHKQKQQEQGRKFHLCDENFLRDAEKLLSSEFATVLDIQPDQVGEYIRNQLS